MEWIRVEDQKPELPCLVYDAQMNTPYIPKGLLTIQDDQGTWILDSSLVDPYLKDGDLLPVLGYQNRITHWMPLPLPPET